MYDELNSMTQMTKNRESSYKEIKSKAHLAGKKMKKIVSTSIGGQALLKN